MGYDAGKKVKARKIHALVDTEGSPLRVVVHSVAIQDRDGAALVFDRKLAVFPSDQAYCGATPTECSPFFGPVAPRQLSQKISRIVVVYTNCFWGTMLDRDPAKVLVWAITQDRVRV